MRLPVLAHPLNTPHPLLLSPAGAGGATPDGSEAGEGSALLPDDDRQLIRQELFLGHLLTLAASSGAVPPHALPSIAAMLQVGGAGGGLLELHRAEGLACGAARHAPGRRSWASWHCVFSWSHLLSLYSPAHPVPLPPSLQADGLIPKWLAFTLTQQPVLFDRAFQRCFSKVCGAGLSCLEPGET